jgi:hypothetical protein
MCKKIQSLTICLLILAAPGSGKAAQEISTEECKAALNEIRVVMQPSIEQKRVEPIPSVGRKKKLPVVTVNNLPITKKQLPSIEHEESFLNLLLNRAMEKMRSAQGDTRSFSEIDLNDVVEYRLNNLRKRRDTSEELSKKIEVEKATPELQEHLKAKVQRARGRLSALGCLPGLLASGALDNTLSVLFLEDFDRHNSGTPIKSPICARYARDLWPSYAAAEKVRAQREQFLENGYIPLRLAQEAEVDPRILNNGKKKIARIAAAKFLVATEREILREYLGRPENKTVQDYVGERKPMELINQSISEETAVQETLSARQKEYMYLQSLISGFQTMPVDKRIDGTSRLDGQWHTIEATSLETQQKLKQDYDKLLKADCPLPPLLLPKSGESEKSPFGPLWSEDVQRVRKNVSQPSVGTDTVPAPVPPSVRQDHSVF